MRRHASLVQVVGVVAVAAGAWLLLPAAGVIVAGVGAVLFGVALERGD